VSALDARPILAALAGPNGAGKTTFFDVRLRASGLRFVNADELALGLQIDAYEAARVADRVRRSLVAAGESFVFETVFSDPAGEKVDFLCDAREAGYTVVLCFIGLANVEISDQRVAVRVAQGGHDVPRAKLEARFGRILTNLERAIERLPHVLVFDNSVFGEPHRQIAEIRAGKLAFVGKPIPQWFRPFARRLRAR
jgi:predicted ABC-type ATPase